MERRMSNVWGAALVSLALAAPVLAQGPPPGGPPPGQGGGFGQPGNRFGGPRGGGFWGQQRPPFAVGTVSAVDAAAGTITLTTQRGRQTIHLGPNAQIVMPRTVSVSSLKAGDRVTVRGAAAGLTGFQITAGQPPAGLPDGGGFGGPRGGNGPTNFGGGREDNFVTASGTVKASPTKKDAHLTISLGPGAQLVLTMADGAEITRYAAVTVSGIKTGDRIIAMGQNGDDGTMTASTVGVNFPAGGFGGGPGAPMGGNFAGGRYGGPPGGFGGPRRTGQRGGPFPDQGGFNGPPPPDQGGFGGPPPPGQDGGPPPPGQ